MKICRFDKILKKAEMELNSFPAEICNGMLNELKIGFDKEVNEIIKSNMTRVSEQMTKIGKKQRDVLKDEMCTLIEQLPMKENSLKEEYKNILNKCLKRIDFMNDVKLLSNYFTRLRRTLF